MTLTPALWSKSGSCASSRLLSHTASLIPRARRESVPRDWLRLTVTCAFVAPPEACTGARPADNSNKQARRDTLSQRCRLKEIPFLIIEKNPPWRKTVVERECNTMYSPLLRDSPADT